MHLTVKKVGRHESHEVEAQVLIVVGHDLEYGMPIDEQEKDRIDMSHAKYYMLLNKRRYLAPISSNTQKVLDLGTGTGMLFDFTNQGFFLTTTGIWSIDFADEHPASEVSYLSHPFSYRTDCETGSRS